jgi:hypothetical protein
MLQEANNFYLGTGIISRLYLGEILVWPFSGEKFWQFLGNSSCQNLIGFRATYSNGSVFVDWGDGNNEEISSNVSYNHVFQPCEHLLTGIVWEITGSSIPTISIDINNKPSIIFNNDGSFTYNDGCNSIDCTKQLYTLLSPHTGFWRNIFFEIEEPCSQTFLVCDNPKLPIQTVSSASQWEIFNNQLILTTNSGNIYEYVFQ